jgi:hypothetical protein
MDLTGEIDQGEEIRAHNDPVVPVPFLLQVVVKGLTVDIVPLPVQFLIPCQFPISADAVLQGDKGLQVTAGVDGEIVHRNAGNRDAAGWDFIFPCKMIAGTGGQVIDLPAFGHQPLGKLTEKGFRTADRRPLGETG